MSDRPFSGFAPSRDALEFGAKYAEVLERWAEMFAASAALVRANVELGETAAGAAEEFDRWLNEAGRSPFSWFNSELAQQFMSAMGAPGRTGGTSNRDETA